MGHKILYLPNVNKKEFVYNGKQTFPAFIYTSPYNVSVTVPTGTTFMIVHLTGQYDYGNERTYGIITYDSQNMTEVNSFAGNYKPEVWYMANPPIGSHTLTITGLGLYNQAVLNVSFWTVSGVVSVYDYSFNSGSSTYTTVTTDKPSSQNNLIVSNFAFVDAVTPPDKLYFGTANGTSIARGVIGGGGGYSIGYILDTSASNNFEMYNNLTYAFNYQVIGTCFIST